MMGRNERSFSVEGRGMVVVEDRGVAAKEGREGLAEEQGEEEG